MERERRRELEYIEVVFLRLGSQRDGLEELTCYGTSMERSPQRALGMLERCQAIRAHSLLAVIDRSGSYRKPIIYRAENGAAIQRK